MAPRVVRRLGELEASVMQILWEEAPLAVRDVARRLGGRLAYTTVMTTLDRLFKKGLLTREKGGNAYLYRPRHSRDEYYERVATQAVSELLAASGPTGLAAFVEAAAAIDEQNLERIERLIALRQRERRR